METTISIHRLNESWDAHVERVVNQVLRNPREHLDASQDILHMIMDVCQIGLRLIAHVAFDPPSVWFFAGVVKGDGSVKIVSTDTVDQRSDRTECAFMKDEVAGDDVYCAWRTIDQSQSGSGRYIRWRAHVA